jgi:hypothetical protein
MLPPHVKYSSYNKIINQITLETRKHGAYQGFRNVLIIYTGITIETLPLLFAVLFAMTDLSNLNYCRIYHLNCIKVEGKKINLAIYKV